MNAVLKILCIGAILCGVALSVLNLYGLAKPLRPNDLTAEHLRFGAMDIALTEDELLARLLIRENETPSAFSKRITLDIAKGIAHIHWARYESTKFHQLIPIWENWILYAMGLFSDIPEYKRYHFANLYKSIERGIGICGDASMIMSQVLDNNGIPSKIVTFPGHVVVSAQIDNQDFIFDPDFGVVIEYSLEQLNANPNLVSNAYSSVGHPISQDSFFINTYGQDYQVWSGVDHFITKKYYFEKFAYLIKWPFPLLLIVLPFWVLTKNRNSNQAD